MKDSESGCASCGNTEKQGHASDCKLAALMDDLRGRLGQP